jgi:hypothetical protein
MMLVVRRNSELVFSKPCGKAHRMHKRRMQCRVVSQMQPYKTRDDRCVVVSRRLFGSGDQEKRSRREEACW